MSQQALDYSVAYAQKRHQFGRSILSFQGLQFLVADLATEIEAARLLVYKAASLIDMGEPCVVEAAGAVLKGALKKGAADRSVVLLQTAPQPRISSNMPRSTLRAALSTVFLVPFRRKDMVKQPEKAESVGKKIHKMRKKLKLELNDLAEKAGCTPEYLKQIEEGKVAPRVGTLVQISRALAVDSASLVAEEKKAERRRSYRKRIRAYAYESLTPDAQDKHLWAYVVMLAPKKPHEMVEYQHTGEEFVYTLEGRVEVKVDDDVQVITKGESIHFNSGIKHDVRNLSSKQSKLLVVVYTPEEGKHDGGDGPQADSEGFTKKMFRKNPVMMISSKNRFADIETQELFLHGLVPTNRGYVTSDTTLSEVSRILAARAVRRVGRNNAR